jgi:hypothetical protein
MSGEIRRRESAAKEIIREPENYADIKKKFIEREEERRKQVRAHYNVSTDEECMHIVHETLYIHADRQKTEHKPLSDYTIIEEPKHPEIKKLEHELSEEINAIGQRILHELSHEIPSLEEKVIGLRQLRGRISKNPAGEQ